MINVVFVDDHELFRCGVKAEMKKHHPDIRIVGEAETAHELFELLKTTSADLILLDVILPDISGIEVVSRLKIENPNIKILAISSEVSETLTELLLNVKIDGFISKRMSNINVLAEAIRTVKDGLEYFGSDISRIISKIYFQNKKTKDVTSEFTEQEKKIIQLCHQRLSCKQIAKQLDVSYRTVEVHKDRIFKKIGINSTKEMIKFALENGIIRV